MEILVMIIAGILSAIGGGALVAIYIYLRDIKRRLKKMEDAQGKRNSYRINDGLEELMAHKIKVERATHYFKSHLESMRAEVRVMEDSLDKYRSDHTKLRKGEKLDHEGRTRRG